MPADWRRLSRECQIRPTDGQLEVPLHADRRQLVTVDDTADQLRIWSVVARASSVDDQVHQRAWIRNRLSEFVGFRVDRRGRLIGETFVPDDVSAEEWAFLVRNLAAACDHFEYLLTGRDTE